MGRVLRDTEKKRNKCHRPKRGREREIWKGSATEERLRDRGEIERQRNRGGGGEPRSKRETV